MQTGRTRFAIRLWLSWILCVLLLILPPAVSAQEVEASGGMVASAHPLASQAGLTMLQMGGNAVDAAVAAAFVLGVVEPNASGIGGGGFLLIKMAGDKPVISIDCRETAPIEVDVTRYYHQRNSFDSLAGRGVYSIGTPGVVAGLTLALEKYGTLTLKEVMTPAIHYAGEGFEVSENLAALILEKYELIQKDPDLSGVFLQESLPLFAGARVVNRDLAASLSWIAQEGPAVFYQGGLGSRIASAVQEKGGLLGQQDLLEYQPLIRQPVQGSYRGYRIYSSAPPAGGGTHLIELLHILEHFDLQSHQPNSAEYLHLLAEAMKPVFADKDENMADPAFYRVPVEQLIGKNHTDSLAARIDPAQARFDYVPPHRVERESGSTTHLSVVDGERHMVALTQSINTWFGSGIMAGGTGIILNNHLYDFNENPGHPNSIEPGKRPVSSIAPTLVLKDGKPFLTIGTPGGPRIISALAQIIINVIDFNMGIDEAIEAPRIHCQGNILHLEGRIPLDVQQTLQKLGHSLKVHGDFDNYFGGAQGILIDQKDQILIGGADSRRDGVAAGY